MPHAGDTIFHETAIPLLFSGPPVGGAEAWQEVFVRIFDKPSCIVPASTVASAIEQACRRHDIPVPDEPECVTSMAGHPVPWSTPVHTDAMITVTPKLRGGTIGALVAVAAAAKSLLHAAPRFIDSWEAKQIESALEIASAAEDTVPLIDAIQSVHEYLVGNSDSQAEEDPGFSQVLVSIGGAIVPIDARINATVGSVVEAAFAIAYPREPADYYLRVDGHSVNGDALITSDTFSIQVCLKLNGGVRPRAVMAAARKKAKKQKKAVPKKRKTQKPKRKFNTAPNLSVPVPATRSTGRAGSEAKQSASFNGKDFWQSIPSGTYAAGSVIVATPIVPAQMGPWLKTNLQLWERWRVTGMTMKYVPSVGSTQPGNLLMFFDPDPTNNWLGMSPGPDLIKRAFTQTGRKDFALWQGSSTSNPHHDLLWTQAQGSDTRLFQAGTFVLVTVTGFTSASDVGALHMDWAVTVHDKTYNQNAITETAFYSHYNAGGLTNTVAADVSMSTLVAGELFGGLGNNVIPVPVGRGAQFGVPIAYSPNFTGNVTDASGTARNLITNTASALAPGTYCYNMTTEGFSTNGWPAAGQAASMCPVITNGNIIDWDYAVISADKASPAPPAGAVPVGYTGSMIVEIYDDANDSCIPVDSNDSVFVTTAASQQTPGVNKVVNKSTDWGIVDWIGNLKNMFGNGIIYNTLGVIADIADFAWPLIFASAHPAMTKRMLAKRKGFECLTASATILPHLKHSDYAMFQQFLAFKATVEAEARQQAEMDDWKNVEQDTPPVSARSEKAVVITTARRPQSLTSFVRS